jgi:hypothetical protein
MFSWSAVIHSTSNTSTLIPLINIAIATSHTGACTASKKNGGRNPNVAMVATRSGCAGRSRMATKLPNTSPMALAVTTTDQPSAPPQCCFATTGPRM